LLVVASLISITACSSGQDTSAEDSVRSILADQVAAWNRGDIEGYMRGYWESDSTLFTSGGTITRGYQRVLARYKKSYDDREKMGILGFHDLVLEPLSPVIVVAMGIWELQRKADRPWGRFTLILQKKPEGWRITHDHTSLSDK
jgi:ketosteroid isomerase-like protein